MAETMAQTKAWKRAERGGLQHTLFSPEQGEESAGPYLPSCPAHLATQSPGDFNQQKKT